MPGSSVQGRRAAPRRAETDLRAEVQCWPVSCRGCQAGQSLPRRADAGSADHAPVPRAAMAHTRALTCAPACVQTPYPLWGLNPHAISRKLSRHARCGLGFGVSERPGFNSRGRSLVACVAWLCDRSARLPRRRHFHNLFVKSGRASCLRELLRSSTSTEVSFGRGGMCVWVVRTWVAPLKAEHAVGPTCAAGACVGTAR